jgi:GDP-L-fucose synthase
MRRLAREDCQLLTVGRDEVDLRRQEPVERWLATNRPDTVFVSAATVGGILANDTRPAEFLYDNLMIAANLIEASHRAGVKKLLFLGCYCIRDSHPSRSWRRHCSPGRWSRRTSGMMWYLPS